jgi:hypothetical protein
MKMNKKLVVATLSTVMGIGLVGSISGTVAWYQYSTRSKTSLVGTEVSRSGTITLSKDGTNYSSRLWTNDILGENSVSFNQVTFGKLNNDGSLPAEARLQPEIGFGDLSYWDVAKKGTDYVQFDLYFRALELQDSNDLYERVAKDIYLTDIKIEDLDNNKDLSKAVRVHFQNKTNAADNWFLSEEAVAHQKLGGNLDMDGDHNLDKDRTGGYDYAEDEAHSTAPVCKYGQYDGDDPVEQVTTKSIEQTKASVNSTTGALEDTTGKFHITTLDETAYAANGNKDVCYTVTIWLEGWHVFEGASDAMWDMQQTFGANFHVGFTFNAGDNVFDA